MVNLLLKDIPKKTLNKDNLLKNGAIKTEFPYSK